MSVGTTSSECFKVCEEKLNEVQKSTFKPEALVNRNKRKVRATETAVDDKVRSKRVEHEIDVSNKTLLREDECEQSLREFNFSSKFVKITKEDMIEKPRRTRDWKGRRAAERSLRKIKAEELLGEKAHSLEDGLVRQATVLAGVIPSTRSTDSFRKNSVINKTREAKDLSCEDLLEGDPITTETIQDFFTSLDDLPDLKVFAHVVQDFFPGRESLNQVVVSNASSDLACTTQSTTVSSVAPWMTSLLKSKSLKQMTYDKRNCRQSNDWQQGKPSVSILHRFVSLLYLIFLQELKEAERLKLQENEIFEKIEKFLNSVKEGNTGKTFHKKEILN